MACFAGFRPSSLQWFLTYQFTKFVDIPTFTYDINNSLIAPSFTRIAYQMKYEKFSVWCELDDFTGNDVSKIGFPTNFVHEVNVTNMYVQVNNPNTGFPDANQATIYNRGPVNGRINFWPSNYGTEDAIYNHDDNAYDTGDGYGSMQIFDITPATPECIFAWNAWNLTNGGDIGIGNQNISHTDWTFRYNANNFKNKKCSIWVK